MMNDDKYHAVFMKEDEECLLEAYRDDETCEVEEEHCQLPPMRRDMPMKPKRPLWRRMARVIITVMALTMLWMAVAPFVFKCGNGMMGRHHKNMPPNDKLHSGDDDDGAEKPKMHYKFDKDTKNFSIKQGRLSKIPTRTTVYGKVMLAAPEDDKVKHITVDFDIHVSDTGMWEKIRIEPMEDGIVVYPDVMSLTKQYVNVTAMVRVPHRKFDEFVVDVTELDIKIAESFTLPINSATFVTGSGNIHATHMGKDGNVDAKKLRVKTMSGDIKGKYGLWKDTLFQTTSGNMDVGIVCYDVKDVDANLRTRTVSGKTELEFENHLHPRPLVSRHESVSGAVQLRYPSDFEGTLKLETTSGAIDVFGKGTKIVKKEKGIAGKLWEVVKGHGDSDATVNTISGNIEVGVGRQQDD